MATVTPLELPPIEQRLASNQHAAQPRQQQQQQQQQQENAYDSSAGIPTGPRRRSRSPSNDSITSDRSAQRLAHALVSEPMQRAVSAAQRARQQQDKDHKADALQRKAAFVRRQYQLAPSTRIVFLDNEECPMNSGLVLSSTPPAPDIIMENGNVLHVTPDHHFCVPPGTTPDTLDATPKNHIISQGTHADALIPRKGLVSWRVTEPGNVALQARAVEASIDLNAALMMLRSDIILERLATHVTKSFPAKDDVTGSDGAAANATYYKGVPRYLLNTADTPAKPPLKEPLLRAVRDLEYAAVPIQGLQIPHMRAKLNLKVLPRNASTVLQPSSRLPHDVRIKAEEILVRLNEYRRSLFKTGFRGTLRRIKAEDNNALGEWLTDLDDGILTMFAPTQLLNNTSRAPAQKDILESTFSAGSEGPPRKLAGFIADSGHYGAIPMDERALDEHNFLSFVQLYDSMRAERRIYIVGDRDRPTKRPAATRQTGSQPEQEETKSQNMMPIGLDRSSSDNQLQGGISPIHISQNSTTSFQGSPGPSEQVEETKRDDASALPPYAGVPLGTFLVGQSTYDSTPAQFPLRYSDLIQAASHDDSLQPQQNPEDDRICYPSHLSWAENTAPWFPSFQADPKPSDERENNSLKEKIRQQFQTDLEQYKQHRTFPENSNVMVLRRDTTSSTTITIKFFQYKAQELLERNAAYQFDPLRRYLDEVRKHLRQKPQHQVNSASPMNISPFSYFQDMPNEGQRTFIQNETLALFRTDFPWLTSIQTIYALRDTLTLQASHASLWFSPPDSQTTQTSSQALREHGLGTPSTVELHSGASLIRNLRSMNHGEVDKAWNTRENAMARGLMNFLLHVTFQVNDSAHPQQQRHQDLRHQKFQFCDLLEGATKKDLRPQGLLQLPFTSIMNHMLSTPLPLNAVAATQWKFINPVLSDESFFNLLLLPSSKQPQRHLSVVLGPAMQNATDMEQAFDIANVASADTAAYLADTKPFGLNADDRGYPTPFYTMSFAAAAATHPFPVTTTMDIDTRYSFPIEPSPLSPWSRYLLDMKSQIKSFLKSHQVSDLHQRLQDLFQVFPELLRNSDSDVMISPEKASLEAKRITQDALDAMTEFYRHRHHGKTPKDALRATQAALPHLKCQIIQLPQDTLCLPQSLALVLEDIFYRPKETYQHHFPDTKKLIQWLQAIQKQAYQATEITSKWDSILYNMQDPFMQRQQGRMPFSGLYTREASRVPWSDARQPQSWGNGATRSSMLQEHRGWRTVPPPDPRQVLTPYYAQTQHAMHNQQGTAKSFWSENNPSWQDTVWPSEKVPSGTWA